MHEIKIMATKREEQTWLDDFQFTNPLVIAGPCSAESEEQVLQIAHELKNTKVSIFRAGIWKPRTRPGGFEGIGEIGLKWLQKVKIETGLQTAIEVANAAHVKLALAHDIDVLWIGARTTVNPFAVQEIADALVGVDKIILIKNPVNPDLALWIGAVERIQNAGIKRIGVIHRGFSTYQKTSYRNNPEWQIAIDFQNRFPSVPMMCDPSHITGKRSMIQEVSQQALDLNYDGLMIETHTDPDNAWSDAAQQITPSVLKTILGELTIRKSTDDADDYCQLLTKLRLQIDEFDAKILENMASRMAISEQIGQLKKEKNVAILQNQRWNAILERMLAFGKTNGLSEEFIVKIFKTIHQESIAKQEKVFNQF